VTIRSSNVSENSGAGVWVWADDDLSVDSSTISGNEGGGISASGDVIVNSSTISQNKGSGVSASGDVTVTSSDISGNSASGRGGGGGIFASGKVTILSSTISNNSVDYYGYGGGIYASGDVMVTSSIVSENSASVGGGGIHATGNVTVISSTFSANSARGSHGGGISTDSGSVTVIDSTISGNSAMDSAGGGISTWGRPSDVTVISSTVSDNLARDNGGGIWATGSVVVVSSTVSGNSVERGSGGGITVFSRGAVSITNSIVAANQGGSSPDVALTSSSGTGRVRHSLIGHKGTTGLREAPVGAPDANGNLIGGRTYGAIDPRLGPLADNGGPTWTHALLPDSPAIDMGDPAAVAGVDGIPLFDQRGQPHARVVHGRIDIGAIERSVADQIDWFCRGLEESDLTFDFSGDGLVDLQDLRLLIEQQLGTSIGDANLDGVFNSSDLVIVFQAGQYEDGIPRNSRWSTGDWNCDREFNSSDMVMAFQAGGYVAAASPAAPPAVRVGDFRTLGAAARADPTMPTLARQSGPAWPVTAGKLQPSPKMMARPSAAALGWAHDQMFVAPQRQWFFADLDKRVERAVTSLLGPPSAEDGPLGNAPCLDVVRPCN
jgi:predicted outer membrane repeat protein